MNEVSNQPLRRSTTPLDSGSFGGSSTSLGRERPHERRDALRRGAGRGRCRARCPRSAAAAPVPAAGSAPTTRAADPRSCGSGSSCPVMNRECAAVITSTGSSLGRAVLERDLPRREPQVALRRVPGRPRQPIRRIDRCGARAAAASRSHGTSGSTRSSRPARRAPSPACPDVSASSARTRASNGVNDVGSGARSYRGGDSELTALITVVREIPNRSAICAFGTPSAASLLINAQSSKVITLQSLSVHFSAPLLSSFRAPSTGKEIRLEMPMTRPMGTRCCRTRPRSPDRGRGTAGVGAQAVCQARLLAPTPAAVHPATAAAQLTHQLSLVERPARGHTPG